MYVDPSVFLDREWVRVAAQIRTLEDETAKEMAPKVLAAFQQFAQLFRHWINRKSIRRIASQP
jgi:hypothetical protein